MRCEFVHLLLAVWTEVARPTQVLNFLDLPAAIRARPIEAILIHEANVFPFLLVQVEFIIATSLIDDLIDSAHDGIK